MFKRWKIGRIARQVNREITYSYEGSLLNNWQPAWLTETLGTGDCEDMCILIRDRIVTAGLLDAADVLLYSIKVGGRGHMMLHIPSMDIYINYGEVSRDVLIPFYEYIETHDLTGWWDIVNPIGHKGKE